MSSRPVVVCLALLALGLLLAVPAQGREPVFEMRALGVLGGEDDGNLSCYLLGKVGEPPRLMLDGGSVLPGVARWMEKEDALPHGASHAAQARATSDVLAQLQALLVTHSHLDHISGFLLASPLLLAVRRAAPLELIALPPIVAIHIKATGYDSVAGELEELRRAGLNVVIPQQGERYRF